MAIVLDDGTELDISAGDSTEAPVADAGQKLDSVGEELGEIGAEAPALAGTSGIGPVASGEEYAKMVNPSLEAEIADTYGTGTIARAHTEAVMPYTNELVAKAYAARYPELSYEQWFNVLTEREKQYRKEWPVASVAGDIGAGVGVGALALASGMGALTPVAQTALAAGYGAAMGPGVPQMTSDKPGYAREAGIAAGLGAAAPVVAGAVMSAAGAGISKIGKWIDNRWIDRVAKKSGDAEVKSILNQWRKEPTRYVDIADSKEARTEALNEMTAAIDSINDFYEKKQITLQEAKEAFAGIKSKYDEMLSIAEKRADQLGIAPSGTAKEVEEQLKNFDDYVMGKYGEAWKNAPQTPEWSMNPEQNGIPLESMVDSAETAIRKVLRYRDKSAEEQAIAAATRAQVGTWVDTIIRNTAKVSDPATIEFIRMNKNLVTDKAARKVLKTNNQYRKMLAETGTTAEQVLDTLRRIDYVDPQEVKEYARLLFRGSSGFNILQDAQSLALESKLGRDVKKAWYVEWAKQFSQLPQMGKFKEMHDVAYELNTTFLKPLQNKIPVVGASRQETTNAFVNAARNTEDQLPAAIRAMSQYGNQNKQNLVDLAERLAASDAALKDIKSMTMDQAIEHIGKQQKMATEAMEVLGRLDPAMKSSYSELERLAIKASNQKSVISQITREAKDYFEKNKRLIGKDASRRPETWLGQISTGRMSRFNRAEQETSIAERGLRELQEYISSGDEMAINSAIERLKKLREIDILNRRTVQGSRQSVQAGAIGGMAAWAVGKATGANLAPLMIPLSILAEKSAREFTHGRWTTLQPYLIEKALNRKIELWNAGIKSGVVSGVITRSIQNNTANTFKIEPGSADAAGAIDAIKQDKTLTPAEKNDTIKKINDTGIEVEI